MSYVVGIDIGGTFTDGVAIDLASASVAVGKTPTTYPDPLPGVMATLAELSAGHDLDVSDLLSGCAKFVHATTLTSNVLLERRGSRVGLVATAGHGDAVLMMSGKGRVAGLSLMERRHFRTTDKPDPIVPRERVIEAPERIDADGDVVVPLTDDAITSIVHELKRLDLEACAVALLWSFRNPSHERQLAEAVQRALPGIFVTRSHELAPLLGEYERTATAVVNAYVGPAVRRYLETVERSLQSNGLNSRLLIVQSSGGVADVEQTEPVNTIESGPAAGVRGTGFLLSQIGDDHAIVTDVGGTTFKVALVRDRTPDLTTETVLGQYSLLVPMIDVVSIGAGGGSIAWADGSRLRVGPKSAGSSPGPACYGWGGTEPTVTDADLVLGYLNPAYFLGGRMELSLAAANEAIRSRVAEPLLDDDVVRAAAGIREIVDAQMADLIRKASLERGHDPRDFVVLAYGGAGPVHCGAYAAELGARRIVIPPNATVYSAFGSAVSDLQHSFQVARQGPAPGDAAAIRADFEELERQARHVLRTEGVEDSEVELSPWIDMRYRRQFYELRIPLENGHAGIDVSALRSVMRLFEDVYTQRYGAGARHGEERIEYVRFGIDAIGRTPKPDATPQRAEHGDATQARKAEREVYWRELGEMTTTPIYDGLRLGAGSEVEGPAVVEHPGTSIAVHPGQRARIDAYLNTIIELGEGADADGRRASHL